MSQLNSTTCIIYWNPSSTKLSVSEWLNNCKVKTLWEQDFATQTIVRHQSRKVDPHLQPKKVFIIFLMQQKNSRIGVPRKKVFVLFGARARASASLGTRARTLIQTLWLLKAITGCHFKITNCSKTSEIRWNQFFHRQQQKPKNKSISGPWMKWW